MNFIDNVKFDDRGLLPAIAQDWQTGEVLMMAYMDRESLEKSVETGLAHYFSRSRQKLWMKGESSGHRQHIKAFHLDCDNDTLLIKIEQDIAACHTGHYSCFFRKVEDDGFTVVSEKVFDEDKVYGN